jgi:vanillate O-demethylase monooxygenase subunit
MPSQETINPSANVRSFPVVEKHRFVWIWPGDPALAHPDLVPDIHWNNDPAWAGDGRTLHIDCNYLLVVDNLMDLTHETYVHGGSIGNDAVAEAPFNVAHGDNTATVTRWMLDIDAPPFWRALLGKPGNVDRWQIIRFEAPCTVVIDVGVCLAGTGAPQGDRSQGVNGMVLNTITPATEKSCHYFWNFVRNFNLADQRLTNLLREGTTNIFHQDEVLLTHQQQAIDDHPDQRFRNLNIDAGAMRARRIVENMVDAEQRKSVAEVAE